jgi:hypothetical protein
VSELAEILELFKAVWDDAAQNMDRPSKVMPYWSEADLVHSLATRFQQSLIANPGTGNLVVKVSSSLIPDEELFGAKSMDIQKFIDLWKQETKKKRVKVIPDIIVHDSGNVEDIKLCGEVKLILGTNYWDSKLESVKDDLAKRRLYKETGISDEAVMAVGFSPRFESPNQLKDLKLVLDESRVRAPHLLRYNC